MRVLITGGTGFVGSHTVAAVSQAGHAVRLLVRRPDKANATEIVLEAAVQARLDPIVHVSSYVALLPSQDVLTPDSPVGVGRPAYPASKALSEQIARRHQSAGAPVVTTYPGAVAGPYDPYFGDTAFTRAMILRNRTPFGLPGRWAVADVGYVADAHAAMLEPGRGPRRYLLGGHDTTWNDLYVLLQEPWIVTHCAGTNDSVTHRELRIEPPPLEQTCRNPG
jgi:nucleoside-diphosphate-sugar epimerase